MDLQKIITGILVELDRDEKHKLNEAILTYVVENFPPEKVFTQDDLCQWAEQNDFVERCTL